jgi:molybdopterin-guanine dinucleotide biosynthesis protein A
MKLSVVIQAGGESKRMGCDKGLVQFLGRSLIQRVIDRVRPAADELLVTSNQPESYQFLGIPVFPDVIVGRGALSGLYTAFSVAKHALVAVVACDMAFVSVGLLAAERETLLERMVDGVVPLGESGYEPFHAVYRREPCRLAVKAALESGQKRADAWFPNVNLAFLTPEEIARVDPAREAFININTPEDLKQAELHEKSRHGQE